MRAAGTARPVPAADGGAGFVVMRVSAEGVVTMSGMQPVPFVPDEDDRLLTTAEASQLVGMSSDAFRSMVSRGLAPKADEPDLDRPANRRMPRWRQRTITDWMAVRKTRAKRKKAEQ